MKTQIVLFSLALAMPAFAQNISSAVQDSTSAAMNAGNNQTVILPAGNPYSFTSQNFKTNQAATAGPAFSSPAVQGTCATAGAGIAGQGVGGGLALALPGGVDAGCDLVRDLSIMKMVNATQDEALARVCMKAEIKKAMGTKCDRQEKTSRAEAILNDSPVASAPVQLLP